MSLPRLTLVTATGGRPEAWALCERWMAAQTRQPDEWVVVDDCEPASACTLGQTVIRPEPRWQHGGNTQVRNLTAAFARVAPEGNVLVIEDDDYYAPLYVERMAERLEGCDHLAGEQRARYYQVVERGWRHLGNYHHASLCQTGFRGYLMPRVLEVLSHGPHWVDLKLWEALVGARVPAWCGDLGGLCVGVKGLPGRPGIGVGHRGDLGFYPDPLLAQLREWIGADAEAYAGFHRPKES